MKFLSLLPFLISSLFASEYISIQPDNLVNDIVTKVAGKEGARISYYTQVKLTKDAANPVHYDTTTSSTYYGPKFDPTQWYTPNGWHHFKMYIPAGVSTANIIITAKPNASYRVHATYKAHDNATINHNINGNSPQTIVTSQTHSYLIDSLATLVVDANYVNATNGGYVYIDIVEDSMNMPSFYGDVNPVISMTLFAKIGNITAFNNWKNTVLVNGSGNPGDDMAVMTVIEKSAPTATSTRVITMDPAVDPNADEDNDGDINRYDCNVFNAAIHHGAYDIPNNGIDEDCSGSDKIDLTILDQDKDGMTPKNGDCNDKDKTVYLGASEIPNNGKDEDCTHPTYEYKTIPSGEIVDNYANQLISKNTINVSDSFNLTINASESEGDWYATAWHKRAVYVPAGVDSIKIKVRSDNAASSFRVHATNHNATVNHVYPVAITNNYSNTTTGEAVSSGGLVEFTVNPLEFNRDNSGGYIYLDIAENAGSDLNANAVISLDMDVADKGAFTLWKDKVHVHFNGDDEDGNPIAAMNTLMVVEKTGPLTRAANSDVRYVTLPGLSEGGMDYDEYVAIISEPVEEVDDTTTTTDTTTSTTCNFWEACYTGTTTSSGGGGTTTTTTTGSSSSTSSSSTSTSTTCHFWEACYTGSSSSNTGGTTTTTTDTSKGTDTSSDGTCNFWENCDEEVVEDTTPRLTCDIGEDCSKVDLSVAAAATREALRAKIYLFEGTFSQFNFSDETEAFNWVFIDPKDNAYRLRGAEATARDVFGWTKVTLDEKPLANWYMFSLGEDIDADGTEKFDWIIVSASPTNKQAYKLSGVKANGTFLYSDKLDVDYELSDDRTFIIFQ